MNSLRRLLNSEYLILQDIVSSDISRMPGFCHDFSFTGNLSPFVNYLIFHMDIFTDNTVCQDHTVFDNCALFDLTSTADNGIFYSSLNQTAIGYNGIFHVSIVKILCGAGIVCPGVISAIPD